MSPSESDSSSITVVDRKGTEGCCAAVGLELEGDESESDEES
jgi:hypothetical protein